MSWPSDERRFDTSDHKGIIVNDRKRLLDAIESMHGRHHTASRIGRAPRPDVDCAYCLGWFVNPGTRREVHRCDECNVYESDHEATRYAVESLRKEGRLPALESVCGDEECTLCYIRLIYPEYEPQQEESTMNDTSMLSYREDLLSDISNGIRRIQEEHGNESTILECLSVEFYEEDALVWDGDLAEALMVLAEDACIDETRDWTDARRAVVRSHH